MSRYGLAALAVGAALVGAGLGGSVAETVSMTVRPTLLRANDRAAVSGVVGSGRADQLVTVQLRPCDETSWRDVAETTTTAGGGWSVDVAPGIGGLLRATSGGAQGEPVRVQHRPYVGLTQRPPGTFRIYVNAQRSFWRKRAVLQRFDAKTRAWVDVRSVMLTESGAPPGVPWIYTESERFRPRVAKGTLLRATLPLPQARPCYLGGYSAMIRR